MTATASSESILAPVSEAPAAPAKKRSRALVVFPAIVLGAAVVAGGWALATSGRESTDDAQVEGRIVNVAPRVQGQVARVLVQDNQVVEEGQVLLELDKADLQAKADAARADLDAAKAQLENARAQLVLIEKNIDAGLTQAKGGLAQASASVTSSQASIAQGQADVAAAQSRLTLAQTDYARVESLRSQGAVAQAALDQAKSHLDEELAAIDQAKARLASARALSTGSSGGVVFAQGRLEAALTGPEQVVAQRAAVSLAEARVKQSESALRLAELNLSYADIRAPHRGEISRRTVEVGQLVGPDRPLLAIVPTDDVWVVANFKEDQLREMHPGEPVKITLDAFGRRTFTGHVDSVAGASGARFALLPPDNATGNYIKVVQRIPVLIRFDGDTGAALRPGMSADVTVDTRPSKS